MIDHAEASRRPGQHAGSRTPALAPLTADFSHSHSALTARIERALLLLAYFIELDGDVHLPMYEKFEAELDQLKCQQAARQRAHDRLSQFRQPQRPERDALKELELQCGPAPLSDRD